jgi:hypothetical protein
MTLNYSVNLMIIFFIVLIFFNISMVPLAQSIWGTYLQSYKTFPDAVNAVLMLGYSKGDLDQILDINFIWSFIFMSLYYSIAIFVIHSAFHYIQTDSL